MKHPYAFNHVFLNLRRRHHLVLFQAKEIEEREKGNSSKGCYRSQFTLVSKSGAFFYEISKLTTGHNLFRNKNELLTCTPTQDRLSRNKQGDDA